MPLWTPERYFSRISHIVIGRDLIDCGFENVLLDIDNTILTRDTHEVPRDVGMWLGKARDAGIRFCLLSNNWHHGVYELAGELELPLVAKAVKPLPPAFLRAKKKLGAKRRNTVVIGAHFVGMAAYMLQPLVEQDLPHTLFLRHFERVLMGDRQPEPLSSVPQAAQQAAQQIAQQTALLPQSAPMAEAPSVAAPMCKGRQI